MNMKLCVNCLSLLTLFVAAAGFADDPAPVGSAKTPAEARSIEEITAAIDQLKGFGTPASAHFRRPERELFATWYCPYSGRDATRLHVYEFNLELKRWTLALDIQFEHTHDLSLELLPGKGGFVVRDVLEKVIYRERAAK